MAESKFVWYPCAHSKSSGKFYDLRAMNETGTLMHEKGDVKTPLHICDQCYSMIHCGELVAKTDTA